MNFELLIVRTGPAQRDEYLSANAPSLLLVVKTKLWREATLDGNRSWWREEPAFTSWMGRTPYLSSIDVLSYLLGHM